MGPQLEEGGENSLFSLHLHPKISKEMKDYKTDLVKSLKKVLDLKFENHLSKGRGFQSGREDPNHFRGGSVNEGEIILH